MAGRQYCIYLIPYHAGTGFKLYCGYTRLDRVAAREQEHFRYDKRTYTGRLCVVSVFTDGAFGLLVSGSWSFTPIKGLKQALAAERFVKKLKPVDKLMAYQTSPGMAVT